MYTWFGDISVGVPLIVPLESMLNPVGRFGETDQKEVSPLLVTTISVIATSLEKTNGEPV